MSAVRAFRWVAVAVVTTSTAVACGTDEPIDDSTVTVFGPYVGTDADRFADVLDDFEQTTGIEVAYTGSVDFVSDLRRRSLGNQQPDVAMVPQPGVVDTLVDGDLLEPLTDDTVQSVERSFSASYLEATPWNLQFAVPYQSNTKSLVWYRPDVFEEQGWETPATLDELDSLVDRILAADEMSPWCFSVFAGSATGWPATDWVEDLVLRRAGVDIYERWSDADYSWQSPEIRAAFEEFRDLVIDGTRSFGGLRAILQTEVADAGAPLFASTPGCAMYKQASFAEDWFPSGTDIGPNGDVDYFTLPSEDAGDTHLVTAGDAAVAFSDRPNVNRFMAYLATADGGQAWADDGGFVSARTDVDDDEYYNDVDAGVASLIRTAPAARFDASDALPADIGSDLLWAQITEWINGALTLNELLESIDEALGIEE